MAGSWEQDTRRVYGAILHTENVTMNWAMAFKNLQIPGQFFGLTGMTFDHGRNAACLGFIQSNADYLFFLDSDVICPPDTIYRLMNHNLPIVSGLYFRRSPPVGLPVAIKNGQHITLPKRDGLVEVDLVGSGCLLIHRSLFQRVPPIAPGKLLFHWRVDLRGSGVYPEEECVSEDYSACIHIRKHNIPVYVDTSIRCDHVGFSRCSAYNISPL